MTTYTYLVLLVLSCVREAWNDSRDSGRRGNFAGVDHDEQLHEVVIHLPAAALDNVHILPADGLADLHAAEERGRGVT